MKKDTTKSIIEKTKTIVGESYENIVLRSPKNKGAFGLVIEEEGFNLKNNSYKGPDFKETNVELKTTPYKKNKNGTYSAKERLVLNIINYMEEYNKVFEESSFWTKNNKMLILFYEYNKEYKKEDYKISKYIMHEFDIRDLRIIKNDWEIIIKKIKEGKAHEISEADTMYLAACTKGRNKESVRKQPFSNVKAKQRAYSLKASYMTELLRKKIFNEENEHIFTEKELKNQSFYNLIKAKIMKYKGYSIKKLKEVFKIKNNPKNLNKVIVNRILNIRNDITKTDEFLKSNIELKTIRVEYNGKIKEDMSFPAFEFEKIVNENWEDSIIKEYFETKKFMFIIFKKNQDDDYILNNVLFWNMPVKIIDENVRKVWDKTKDVIKKGNIVKEVKAQKKGVRYMTNFPGKKFDKYCHIRPHAQSFKDKYKLPVNDKLTGMDYYMKHCFWLSKTYVREIINEKNN